MDHAPAVQPSCRNRSRVSTLDEQVDEVSALLAVDDAGEAAVLPLDEHARMDENVR
jgi:hypothetical protein